jgi:anti-sigma28 factor (negative regulator of flagellin synthesis)
MRIDPQTTQGLGNVDASKLANSQGVSSRSTQDVSDLVSPDVVSLSAGSKLLELAKSMGARTDNTKIEQLSVQIGGGTYASDPFQVGSSLLNAHIRA